MLSRILEPEAMDTAEEAEEYDLMDHTEANAAFIERLFELGAHGLMLDLGTGPGHMPPVIAERAPEARIVAIDLAHHMLARARERLAATPFADRIEYQHMDAKALTFEDGSFDTVYSNTILHHIPDPRPFLREAARVLRPGGVLLIRDLYRPDTQERLTELVELYAGACTQPQRDLFGASLHAAFTPQELEALARECGLGETQVVIDTDRHMSLQQPRPHGR